MASFGQFGHLLSRDTVYLKIAIIIQPEAGAQDIITSAHKNIYTIRAVQSEKGKKRKLIKVLRFFPFGPASKTQIWPLARPYLRAKT